MKYLLDSNILRSYTARDPLLAQNLGRVPASEIGIPFVVVIEQLRGRFDAYLKADPENLLKEQERLRSSQKFLSTYQTIYVNERAVEELIALCQRVNTRKRYVDVVIAAIALARDAVVVTRNVDDFRDLLPAARVQNWIDHIY